MLENLTTEARNERTMRLDEMSVVELLTVMNEEDAKVAGAVKEAIRRSRRRSRPLRMRCGAGAG
ncbi:hypothetical protein HMSSN036_10280 [Paenibacillus macerans]|nr:hypothetical protein HMSSN036_10280 [Paenibacillus macerans]